MRLSGSRVSPWPLAMEAHTQPCCIQTEMWRLYQCSLFVFVWIQTVLIPHQTMLKQKPCYNGQCYKKDLCACISYQQVFAFRYHGWQYILFLYFYAIITLETIFQEMMKTQYYSQPSLYWLSISGLRIHSYARHDECLLSGDRF